MYHRLITLASFLLLTSIGFAQEAPAPKSPTDTTAGSTRTLYLELMQLRWNAPGEALPDAKTLLASFAQLRESGKLTDAETIQLSVLEGQKCSAQFGRQIMITTATTTVPGGRGAVRSMQSLDVGTMVRATIVRQQDKLQVELSYEASQLAETKQEDIPPTTTRISADSTLLLTPGELTVVASRAADTSIVLLARITE
jgi:hypothetical protein